MKKSFFFALALPAILAGCSPKNNQASSKETGPQSVPPYVVRDQIPTGGGEAMILKATVFKMSGDYADNVAVTVGADGRLLYYPAPTDITEGSKPTLIGNGWYLNRQGLGPNSVFTKWTFEEYRQLLKTPSQEEIKAAILPGAEVTEFRRLPIPAAQAAVMEPSNLLHLVEE